MLFVNRLVERDEIVGRHFSIHASAPNPAVLFNATLIKDCFPILLQVNDTGFCSSWPAVYLGYAVGFAVSRGNSISAAMLLLMGAGIGIVVVGENGCSSPLSRLRLLRGAGCC